MNKVIVKAALPVDGYRLEDQIGFLLRRAHQFASSIFQETIAPVAFTPQQFASLVKIGELGEVSQNELGRLIDMDPATTQGVVGRMVERGYVLRIPDSRDKRRLRIRLTDEGRHVVVEAIAAGRKITQKTLSNLDAAERDRLVRLLRKLVP